jgi:hypothetical protein
LFQVVNGKPLIFELYGETFNEKSGILCIPKNVLNFYEVPIGNINYITSPFEIRNISSVKIKFMIDKSEVQKFIELYNGFEIFKIDNYEGTVAPGESRFLTVYFRPLSDVEYKLDLNLYYTDELNTSQIKISFKGKGYHPLKISCPEYKNPFSTMPLSLVCKYYNNQMIQKCGFSIEDLDFGVINFPKNKTFILYNFSEENSFNFDFVEPHFLLKDELQIIPNKGVIEAGKHKIIKCILTPNETTNCNYDGDISVKIAWNIKNKLTNNNLNSLPTSINLGKIKKKNFLDSIGSFSINNNSSNAFNMTNMNISRVEKENLFLRVSKKSEYSTEKKILSNNFNLDSNSSFVELILTKLIQEILISKDFIEFFKNIDNQPLTLYKWTNNEIAQTLQETRMKYIKNLNTKIHNLFGDLSQVSSSSYKRTGIFSEMKTFSRRTTFRITNNELDVVKENYTEEIVDKLEEKYFKEIIDKFNYTTKEINEKLIIINDETKKVIIDTIMENTIYNIICEAVYGEINLSEKQRIYFFLDQNTKNIINGYNDKKVDEENNENKDSKKINKEKIPKLNIENNSKDKDPLNVENEE